MGVGMTTTTASRRQPHARSRTYLRTRTAVRVVFYTAMCVPLAVAYIQLLLAG